MKSIRVDFSKTLAQEPATGHNRWHSDIPPVIEVDPGEEVEIDTRDAFDGQITRATVPAEVGQLNLNLVHPLTGPVWVKGAQPGDLLEVETLEVQPKDFGYTILVPGFGFLRDYFSDPHIVKWDIKDGYATSADLPGVRIADSCFMGTIGIAPSKELQEEWVRREADLLGRGGAVLGPNADDAVPSEEPIASTAVRTIPPRENAGNIDIKQLTKGSKLLLPVFTEGALFSAGDAHFAQGDGEACGTAIEMSSTLLVKFDIRKGEAAKKNIRFPRLEREDYYIAPAMAAPKRFVATVGMSVLDGVNESENVTMSCKHALLQMIDLLMERGWTREKAYTICSVAVDLKVSELVDVPNLVVTAFLPLDIFDS